MPDRTRRAELARALPDALLFTLPKSRSAIERDFKWLDSYRYGLVHLGARDAKDLRNRCARAAAVLGWPNAPYLEERMDNAEPAEHVWQHPSHLGEVVQVSLDQV